MLTLAHNDIILNFSAVQLFLLCNGCNLKYNAVQYLLYKSSKSKITDLKKILEKRFNNNVSTCDTLLPPLVLVRISNHP